MMIYHFEILNKYFIEQGKCIFNPKQPGIFKPIQEKQKEHVSTLRLKSAFAEFVKQQKEFTIMRLSDLPSKEYYSLELNLTEQEKYDTFLIERM